MQQCRSRCRSRVLKKQLVLLHTLVLVRTFFFSPTKFYTKFVNISENDKITEWSRLEGMLPGHLLQCPFSSRAIQSQLRRNMSRQLFDIMQGRKHHNIPRQPVIGQYHSKKPFLVYRGSLQCFSLSPLSLVVCH